MNDQHPHAGPVGYDTRSTGSFDTDPLFGTFSGDSGTRDTTDYTASGYDGSYVDHSGHNSHGDHTPHSGQYDSSAWDTGAQQTGTYDAYAAQPQTAADTHQQWDTGATGAWQQPSDQDLTGPWATTDTGAFHTADAGFTTAAFGTAPYETGAYDTGAYGTSAYTTPTYGTGTAYVTDGPYATDGSYGTAAYDTGAYGTIAADDTGAYATTSFTTGVHDTGVHDTGVHDTGAYDTGMYDSGAYDATAWNSGATPGDAAYEPEQTSHQLYEQQASETAEPEAAEQAADRAEETASTTAEFAVLEPDAAPAPDDGDAPDAAPLSMDRTVVRTAPAPRNRARRRSPAKRSALLTVAVPSACVMSVAGIAAASVSGINGGEEKQEDTTSLAVADPSTVKAVTAANKKLDSQLEQLTEGSDDFRVRASRTQERIDLKQRQVAEKKKREEEAARREALRPKFVLPVKQHGLSAYYGQAGVNWMSVHTGIDFPVGYGTPVMAATDGTVRTQFNSAYGNMAIVTMADGTETWYCHLSSTRIRSGPVKAGDVIAYAGSSGNSTGPHLHFEVRPGGGASIDPLAWLRSHGVNAT
ncbi:M23 family metallopeptidase [Streptomyces sp. cmx-18-6]|uniref:M23 family metallopeptidase n=1 Tax=Streptomyces sp. cmx-18-6 TaxID=2790930 RepID=UPI00397FC931